MLLKALVNMLLMYFSNVASIIDFRVDKNMIGFQSGLSAILPAHDTENQYHLGSLWFWN